MSPYDLRRYHPIAIALIVGIPLIALGLIAWDLSRGGSERLPTDYGSTVTRWTVCPSILNPEAWVDAAAVVEGLGLPTPIAGGPCDGPPEIGEVQIRYEGDQVDPFREPVPDGYIAHLASVGRPVERGVIYVDTRQAGDATREGELVHSHGIGIKREDGSSGHASSGRLNEHHDGLGWALVERVIAARSADTDGPLP